MTSSLRIGMAAVCALVVSQVVSKACVTHDAVGNAQPCAACGSESSHSIDELIGRAPVSEIANPFAFARGGGDATVPVYVLNFGYSTSREGPFMDPVINLGDTVEWIFDTPFHTVTSVTGSAETYLSPVVPVGGTFSHTFTTPGEFIYYCEVHGFDNGDGTADIMWGKVTVQSPPNTPGDFNNDQLANAADIDLLFAATPGAIPPANALYDVNNDQQVINTVNTKGSDADYWVRTIKSTEYGDANLDGRVGFDDLLLVAQNYGATAGAGWALGSFNGDGAVNFDDLLALAQNYGAGSGVVGGTSGADFESQWQLARSLVPEPLAITLLAPAFCLGRRRLA